MLRANCVPRQHSEIVDSCVANDARHWFLMPIPSYKKLFSQQYAKWRIDTGDSQSDALSSQSIKGEDVLHPSALGICRTFM